MSIAGINNNARIYSYAVNCTRGVTSFKHGILLGYNAYMKI